MPNYTDIRDMLSHRVTFEYDTGARLVGYLAAVAPEAGKVQYAVLSKAQIYDHADKIIAEFDELPFVPNNLVGFRVAEGPL